MRLNELTVTAVPKKVITLKTVEKLLQTSYSQNAASFKTQNYFWKGFDDHSGNRAEIFMMDPSQGLRTSKNTSNHYTMLIDNSPAFKGWPMRSKSLIGTTDHNSAGQYGTPYAVFPINGSKIATVNKHDIWDVKINLKSPDDSFEQMTLLKLTELLYQLGIPGTGSFKQMVAALSAFNNEIFGYKNGKAFLMDLMRQFTPDRLGFTLRSIPQFARKKQSSECWVSGPCILVWAELLSEI